MHKDIFPEKQGMYDPRLEKDSCGVGFVANIKGIKSHNTIVDGLTILDNLAHRGATGSDPETGDGAGILLQIPHRFFKKVLVKENIELPKQGKYCAGMIFLPRLEEELSAVKKVIEETLTEEKLENLGWRKVPVNPDAPGRISRQGMPEIFQIFISNTGSDVMTFERKLYVARKIIGEKVRNLKLTQARLFHIPSFSSKTIVYKGQLIAHQVPEFFPDLTDPDMESALALVHQRYSTNTFPSWDLAHPFRFLAHNGEINTLRGNINWMASREAMFESEAFGDDIKKIFPIIRPYGSDSSCFDNALELLLLSGRSLPHAMMMLIPEAWGKDTHIDEAKKAFYEFHAAKMEPWDGPAAMAFTDGEVIGATLDRNGLRPARYIITRDDRIILASEAGTLPVKPEEIVKSWRLQPGKILICDLNKGEILDDKTVKSEVALKKPYKKWVDENSVRLDDLPEPEGFEKIRTDNLTEIQKSFGYTQEAFSKIVVPMAETGVEPIGSMGADTPQAVLSTRTQPLYSYFKQLFAQVTNPPIDPIREELVMSLTNYIGSEGNLLSESPKDCHRLEITQPILRNLEIEKLRNVDIGDFKTTTLSMLFNTDEGEEGFQASLKQLCRSASDAVANGFNIAILSDRGTDEKKGAIPALLATAAVHHHLIREGVRGKIGLVIETGEAREVHHFALLLGYGAGALNPYIVFESLENLRGRNLLKAGLSYETAAENYIKACGKGLLKVFSKMGISTLQSYMGAQIFEAIGLDSDVIESFFTNTHSKISGISISDIAKESIKRHNSAYPARPTGKPSLDSGGEYSWRRDGEYHMYNPETIAMLQKSTRTNDFKLFKEYTSLLNEKSRSLGSIRGLIDIKIDKKRSIPVEEVEPASEIAKRFATGAMSYGSISKEAHETLAVAMNRLGGRSNTGEGGEDPDRFTVDEDGDLRRSAIKQVASGRFGVTSNYLTNADELQIKMAQGAKPGEGGQLPGHKVSETIGRVRHTTPGVGLISPPPHHDIYSIEDLAQLIYDLKNSNPKADVSVKLVSEVGVGVVAAGVSKGKADKVLISGAEGGTGASPISSIKHAGAPLELGLAETQQTLVLNDLRSRIIIQADGQIKTGRDIAIISMLGADEFGFATSALIVSGCIMMRKCHLNTCPVGIATQNPELRKQYKGKAEHLVNYFTFLAEEVRQIMADLGYRKMSEMTGQSQNLDTSDMLAHWKTRHLDLAPLFHKPEVDESVRLSHCENQDHGLENILDRKLIEKSKLALENGVQVEFDTTITNKDRTAGTTLGHEVTKRYGKEGLTDDTIRINLTGTAGQSFGAFVPRGVTLSLTGYANDYVGKGLSGGKIIVKKPAESAGSAKDNIIVGNTLLYGATSGEAYFNGVAGERFAVRNSGAHAVVEGLGDHGCEYMTGGRVVVIGTTGRNFAAGMSGGIAYVFDEESRFKELVNNGMVGIEKLSDSKEISFVRKLIENHLACTDSVKAKAILEQWEESISRFVKVMPHDYKRVLNEQKRTAASTLKGV